MVKRVSVIEKFLGEINQWIDQDKDVGEAIEESKRFIGSTTINDKAKHHICQTLDAKETITEVVMYLYNSLLKYIGMGVH